MRILVAGLGSIGSRHARNLLALGHRDLLFYRSGRSTIEPEAWHAEFPTYNDLAEALDQKPDVVFVTNPTALHMPVALEAARAGCHLFIEKPLAHSLDLVEELRSEVVRRRLVVAIGCNFRFHPLLEQAKAWVEEGLAGQIIAVMAECGQYLPDWHPSEDHRIGYSARADLGGGVILTTIHPLDTLYWIFGDADVIGAVAARMGELQTDVEDVAQIALRFRRGFGGFVHVDYVQRPPVHTLTIIGERGRIHWNYFGGALTFSDRAGVTRQLEVPVGFERNAMFLAELRHFLECLGGRAQTLVPLDDGIEVLRMAVAAKEMAKQVENIEKWS